MTTTTLPTAGQPVTELQLRERRISNIASRQRRLIRTDQLNACGVDSAGIVRRIRNSRLFVVHRGLYSVGAPVADDDIETLRLAATMACPDGSALSRLSALADYGHTRFRAKKGTIEVEVPRRVRAELEGVELRETRALDYGQVRVGKAGPVTNLAWTIAELGTSLTAEQICNVIHQSRLRRWVKVADIRAILATNATRSGRRIVLDAIEAYEAGSAGTRSFLEDRFLEIVRRVLGRVPLVNVHVQAGTESFEVDVPLLEYGRLCVEVDGPLHDEPNQQAKDRARDAALRAAGYRVVRFHWTDIEDRPEWCERRLREVMAA